MNRLVLLLATIALAAPSSSLGADKAGCTDHPLFPTRMPEYALETCKTEEFGRYELFASKGPRAPVEGKVTFLQYAYTGPRASEPSGLAVVRNYENAITKVGGTVLQSDPQRWVNARIVKDGHEAWAQVEKGNGKIWLRVIERRDMVQHVLADAAAWGKDLDAAGHVAVYGIYFDTGKAEVKPESSAALQEIAKLLSEHPSYRLKVVGHTDMTGALDANMKLSKARADAVVKALVAEHGVAGARLDGHGVGPLAPVASNDTEEGRARNRRVELVKD